MLQSIKGSLSSAWLRYSLFGVLIMSFGVWGIGDILRRVVSPSDDSLVDGRGISIDQRDFARAWQNATAPFRAQGLSNDQLMAGPLPHLLLERLVARALLQKESKRLRVSVPPSVLRGTLANNPLFSDADGKFAGWQFASFLRESGLSEEAYLGELGNNLIESSLLDNLTFSVSLPRDFVRYLLAAKLERRSLEILRISATRASSIADPGDKRLRAFMRDEEALFQLSEYRQFAFLEIGLSVAKTVADSIVRAEYEARRESLKSPELRSYSQLFFADEELANEVMELYAGGKDFEQAARAVDSGAPIRLSKQSRDGILDSAIADGVFSLGSVGEVKLVEGSLGWYALRLDAVLASRLASFDELRDELSARIALEQATEQYENDIAQAEDMILTGASIDEIAESLGGRIEETLLIDSQGRVNQGINELDDATNGNGNGNGIGSFDRALKKLSLQGTDEAALLELGFSLSSVGEVASGLEILGAGDLDSRGSDLSRVILPRVILLGMRDLQEPRLAELEASNRTRVLAVYRDLQADEQTSERVKKIADRVRQQGSLSAIAHKQGIALLRANVGRTSKDWRVDFLDRLFIAQPGDVLTTFGNEQNQNARLVVRLSAIERPAVQELSAAKVEAFASKQGEDRELPLSVYEQVLESRAGLKINERAFEGFISTTSQGAAQSQ